MMTSRAVVDVSILQRVKMCITKRESEVLLWCGRGKSNREIGKILSISEHGAEFHLRNIFRKFETYSRVVAVVKAMQMGLIQP